MHYAHNGGVMSNVNWVLECTNNIDWLGGVTNDTYHACITDPPYGMGMAEWDNDVPPTSTWEDIHRVLRPGAFCVSFCSPQLYHRLATNIEVAGFRVVDMVFWIVTTKMAKFNRLKPAHEPICIAQKALDGSLAENIVKWGCGAINVDNNRVPWGTGEMPTKYPANGHNRRAFGAPASRESSGWDVPDARGRFPSNVIGYLDEANHQRYFYAPRVTEADRGKGNDHPTPKPVDLMRYLVSIYSPVGGVVLDPFSGSGSTGLGAVAAGRNYVGLDCDQHYTEIARRRLEAAVGSDLCGMFSD